MFNFLKGKQESLKVALDRESGEYLPGETVTATITFETGKEIRFQEGRAVLICLEEFDYRSWDESTDSDGNTDTTLTEHRYSLPMEFDPQVFLLDTALGPGTVHTFSYKTQIPAGTLASVPGKIIKVRWFVKATLDRKLASDFNAEAPLTVPVPPAGEKTAGQYGQSSEMEQTNLHLELPGTVWLSSETVSGTLVIRPVKSFDVTQVRLELVRSETVSYDQGLAKEEVIKVKLADKMRLEGGQTVNLPFKVQFPIPCPPSAASDDWTLVWKVKGVLARFLRKDTTVEQEITVFTGKA